MKIIYLEWIDAFANAGWFTNLRLKEEIEKRDFIIKETGIVLRETKKYLILCSGWIPEDEFREEQFCNVHKIPKTWIRKRKTLTKIK